MKCIPGVTSASDNPVIRLLEDLKISDTGSMDDDGKAVLLDQLLVLCSCDSKKSSEFTSVAVRNGGIAILCSLCSGLHGRGSEKSLVLALCNLNALLKGFAFMTSNSLISDIINSFFISINENSKCSFLPCFYLSRTLVFSCYCKPYIFVFVCSLLYLTFMFNT